MGNEENSQGCLSFLILAEWKLAGWERTYGRAPDAGDYIVPTRNMTVLGGSRPARTDHPRPARNIVDVYTTFTWPALCEEIRKLRVLMREGMGLTPILLPGLLPFSEVPVDVGEV